MNLQNQSIKEWSINRIHATVRWINSVSNQFSNWSLHTNNWLCTHATTYAFGVSADQHIAWLRLRFGIFLRLHMRWEITNIFKGFLLLSFMIPSFDTVLRFIWWRHRRMLTLICWKINCRTITDILFVGEFLLVYNNSNSRRDWWDSRLNIET